MPALGLLKAPTGIIIKWSGLLSTIPPGWILCDGNNGTPDMRARFSRQVLTNITNPGSTGGSDTEVLTISTIPAHGHGVSNDSHSHNWGGGNYDEGSVSPSTVTSQASNLGTITIGNTGSGFAHENRPAYYEVAFIQKV